MVKLKNPYAEKKEYNCFGCSPENPIGLRLEFFEDGNEIVSLWEPGEGYQGYHRVLHGGIQATMLDEVASWYVFIKLETAGMTSGMEVVYKKPVIIDNGTVELRAAGEAVEKKRARMRCRLLQKGEVKSEALCEYAIFPPALAKNKFHYPGVEAFYFPPGS